MKRVLVGAVLATLLMPAAVTMARVPSTLSPSAETADPWSACDAVRTQ